MTDLADAVRTIIDGSVYLTLATSGPDGAPWATPVYFATADYHDIYWMSSPQTTHSRNLAEQPEVGVVIFDSTQAPLTGSGVWMSGRAEQVTDTELPQALSVYPGERGGRDVRLDQVQAPSPYRLYRLRVDRYWTMCSRDTGPCVPHGNAFDHRIEVQL